MEQDTGASLTIISEETYHTIAAQSLQDSEVSPKTYTGYSIPFLGSVLVQVEHGGEQMPLLVLLILTLNLYSGVVLRQSLNCKAPPTEAAPPH